eukprot:429432-Rhodomonas_salina.2
MPKISANILNLPAGFVRSELWTSLERRLSNTSTARQSQYRHRDYNVFMEDPMLLLNIVVQQSAALWYRIGRSLSNEYNQTVRTNAAGTSSTFPQGDTGISDNRVHPNEQACPTDCY